MIKKVLFHRHYQTFSGGHLKVLDYFRHTQAAEGYGAEIYLTQDSQFDHPWRDEAGQVDRYRPLEADALFIAGMDWQALDAYPGIEESIPVINLIQHVRHASPNHAVHRFLVRRATRICVSAEVADALHATGVCNGPIHTIPNCIDRTLMPPRPQHASIPTVDAFICGYKRPDLATDVANRLARQGLSVDCITTPIPRHDFLVRMLRSRLVILLPHLEEGFYLPALEAMAMGCLVICPDCIGNRAFCINEVTALVPDHDAAAIEVAVTRLMRSPALADCLLRGASSVSQRFDIDTERRAYHRILRETA